MIRLVVPQCQGVVVLVAEAARVEGLVKHFGDVRAVGGVDLSIGAWRPGLWRALERLAGVAILTAVVTAVTTVALSLTAQPFDLDGLPGDALWPEGVAVCSLALSFAGTSFGLGAATGARGMAVVAGSAFAAGTHVLYGLAGLVASLHDLRWLSPGSGSWTPTR